MGRSYSNTRLLQYADATEREKCPPTVQRHATGSSTNAIRKQRGNSHRHDQGRHFQARKRPGPNRMQARAGSHGRATFAAATLLELLSKARPGRRYQPACRHRTEYLCQRKQSQNVPCSIFETARLSSSQLRAHFDSSDSERISLRARAPVGPPLLFSRLTN